MTNRLDYQVRFLAADGSPMEDVALQAKSLPIAVDCAAAVGLEIGAATFYISPKPEDRSARPNAPGRCKPAKYRQSGLEPAAGSVNH